ncbi:hypothetical protein [Geomicrobium sediminis]|uniref:HK97 gp10 family phage protein n=1 Tax=Geomicrobium sediminis TaxID=1347788 RepID=A0ABS2PEJ7_9BACL|nr:hypothetical protein [Geomicrobium sediminis]MBM7633833.1 hypothetical protein [Geomicrobium sediminis]
MSKLGGITEDRLKRNMAALYILGNRLGKDMERHAKTSAPWTDRTGSARGGIQGGAEKTTRGATIVLAHSQQHGAFLELGTGLYGPIGAPYDIVPTLSSALFWDGANHPVTSVRRHPGMEARPILKPTAERHKHAIKRSVQQLFGGN